MTRTPYTTHERNVNYTQREIVGAVAIGVGAVAAVIVAAMAPAATAAAAVGTAAAAAVRRAGVVGVHSSGPPDEADGGRRASEPIAAD